MIARCFGCRLPSSPWIAPLNNVDGGIIKLCGAVFVPPRATLICRHNGDDKRKRGKEREQVGLGKRESALIGWIRKELIIAGLTRFATAIIKRED